MSFQDINYYYYDHYRTFIHCWQEKVSHILEKKLKSAKKRRRIIYLYKSVNIPKFQESSCGKVK